VLAASGSAATAAKAGGTLAAALTGEPDSLDPASPDLHRRPGLLHTSSRSSSTSPRPESSTACRQSWKRETPRPGCSTSSESDLHNGDKFTAADVKYTFERILTPRRLRLRPLYTVIEAVEVVSPTRGVFHSKRRSGRFLETNLANNGEIVNRKRSSTAKTDSQPGRHRPVQFVDWVQGDHVTEEIPPLLPEGRPYLDRIQFRFMTSTEPPRRPSRRPARLADAIPLQHSTRSSATARSLRRSALAGIPDFLASTPKKPPVQQQGRRQAVRLGARPRPRSARSPTSAQARRDRWKYRALEVVRRPRPSTRRAQPAKAKALLKQAGHAKRPDHRVSRSAPVPELLKTGGGRPSSN